MMDGGDPVTVLHERHPIAVKEHKCNECRRVIARGESYMVERYVFDGEAQTHKTCLHCQIARQWLVKECNGFLYTMVEEDINEHVHEGGYGMDLARVAVGMGRHWKRRDGQLMPIPKLPLTTEEKMARAKAA